MADKGVSKSERQLVDFFSETLEIQRNSKNIENTVQVT